MARLLSLFMVMGTAGCIVDDWRFQPLDAALADADVAKPTDEDAVATPAADVPATPDADVTAVLDADAPDADASDDAPDGLDADVADVPDAEVPPPPPDISPPPPGVVVRGGIAPSGAHVSATVRVRGTLTLGARHCNAAGSVCVSGGISP